MKVFSLKFIIKKLVKRTTSIVDINEYLTGKKSKNKIDKTIGYDGIFLKKESFLIKSLLMIKNIEPKDNSQNLHGIKK